MAPIAPVPTRDIRILFATRAVRLFAYGFLSVVLVLHLSAAGLSEASIGVLLTLTLLGDTAVSLLVTTRTDRAGGRRPRVFACDRLAGAFATALGALAGGTLASGLQRAGWTPLASYRAVV